jgi:pyridoxine kinase
MLKQKRVAAIHDISCFGKCSLTVALPVISAMGVEVSAIPTAVLSTHTGGFTGYTFRDLTEDILPIVRHWQGLNLHFDAIYTGYLGSFQQIDIVREAFRALKSEDTLLAVDPVMADNGKLYAHFPADFPEGMRKLCAEADVIMPNLTEAALLLNEPYVEGPYDQGYIKGLLTRLSKMGPRRVVLTGVWFDLDKLGAASYDQGSGTFGFSLAPRIEGYYHGTGDVFASVLVGALLSGCGLQQAVELSVNFTAASIRRTRDAGTDIRFGVNFEAGLPTLAEEVKLLQPSD